MPLIEPGAYHTSVTVPEADLDRGALATETLWALRNRPSPSLSPGISRLIDSHRLAGGIPIAPLDADGNKLPCFDNPMDAVLYCVIDGHFLFDIMDDFTDIECG